MSVKRRPDGLWLAEDGTIFKHLRDASEWTSGALIKDRAGQEAFQSAASMLVRLSRSFDALWRDMLDEPPVTTGFLRRPEETDAIYANDPKRRGVPSVHELGRAVDKRLPSPSKNRAKQIVLLVDYLNDRYVYDPTRPAMRVAIHHDVGAGDHFHLQVSGATIDRVKSA